MIKTQNFNESKNKQNLTKLIPQIYQIYNVNQFIDAIDSQGQCRVALIIQKNQKLRFFKVRFDGWDQKWDQSFKFNSNKLKHFRTITLGYTGPKIEANRPTWQFESINHQKKYLQLKKFVDTFQQNKSPHYITQFLRGNNYFYIDFLLGHNYNKVQEVESVIKYLKCHLDLTKKFIQKIDPSFTKYYQTIQKLEQSIICDPDASICHSYYQILDSCISILGGSDRLKKIYNVNKQLILPLLKNKIQTFSVEEFIKPNYFNYFIVNGGWSATANLIAKLNDSKVSIPLSFLKILFGLCNRLNKLGQAFKQKNQKNNELLIKIFRKKLVQIDQGDIKNLDIQLITQTIQKFKSIFSELPTKDSLYQHCQKKQLEISQKFIRSSYFDKKLKGILNLKTILENIIKQNNYKLIPTQFVNWSLRSNILQEIFSKNNHPEIFNRASQLFIIFSDHQLLNQQIIDFIWNLRQLKQQNISRLVDKLFLEFVQKLQEDHLDHLFSKINSSLKHILNHKQMISLVKKLIQKVLKRQKITKYYGLQLFYQLALGINDEKSIQDFVNILKLQNLENKLNDYIEISIKSIQKQQNSSFHINLLLKISHQIYHTLTFPENIISIIIKDLIKNSNKTNSEIKMRFNLLQMILKKSQVSHKFIYNNFELLWQKFKFEKCKGQKIFLNWICGIKQGKYQINEIFDNDLKTKIFEEILINFNKNKMDYSNNLDVETFIIFFIEFNIIKNNFNQIKDGFAVNVKNFNEILGFEQIWHIFLETQNDQIIAKIIKVFTYIYLYNTPKLTQKQKKQIIVKQIRKMFSKIIKYERIKNYKIINRIIRLLNQLVSSNNQDQLYTQSKRKLKIKSIKKIKLINDQKNQTHQINFNVNLAFGYFRNQICKLFQKPIKSFKLFSNQEQLTDQINSKIFKMCDIQQPIHYRQTQSFLDFIKTNILLHFQKLFNLLENQSAPIIWKLLQVLPLSKQFVEKVYAIKSWTDKTFSSSYQSVYVLKIIQKMDGKNWQNFVKIGGISNILISLKKKNVSLAIQKEQIKIFLSLILKNLCSEIKDKNLLQEQTIKNLVQDLLFTLFKICQQSTQIKFDDDELQSFNQKCQEQILKNIFFIIEKIKTRIPVLKIILQSKFIFDIVEIGIIQYGEMNFQQILSGNLSRLILEFSKNNEENIKKFLVNIFNKLLSEFLDLDKSKKLKIFFYFLEFLIKNLQTKILKAVIKQLPDLIQKLIAYIQKNPCLQTQQQPNINYQGVLKLINTFISKKQQIKINSSKKQLIEYILNVCLFNITQKGSKCKSLQTRQASFKLLLNIIQQNSKYLHYLINYLKKFHMNADWRTDKPTDWIFTIKKNKMNQIKYVGLKNLGCICYMNSLLQQLFMIPQFSQAILDIQDISQIQLQDNVLYQLKKMFLNLKFSQREYYDPKQFCYSFKDYEGNPTNTKLQMDIDQFSNILLDKLQNQLKGTKNQTLIKDHFGGIYSNQIICSQCNHFFQRQEHFLSIILHIKNKKNILESLNKLIEGQILEGDNSYYCNNCQKKVKARNKMYLKQIPDNLIIVLKRFEFDYQTMNKQKINDTCQFPNLLNLQEYHYENSSSKFIRYQNIKNQYFEFQLKGVVIHMGSGDYGHYYSYIRERNQKNLWYEFNDQVVKKIDSNIINQIAFGGNSSNKSAYVLIYERKQKLKITNIQKNRKNQQKLEQIKKQIEKDNQNYHLFNFIFSVEYQIFINKLINQIELFKIDEQTQILKFTIIFLMTVSARCRQKQSFFNILQNLRPLFRKNLKMVNWTINQFAISKILIQFFKHNTNKDIKRLIANWIFQLCQFSINEQENENKKRLNSEFTSLALVINFINSIIQVIFQNQLKNCQQLFQILFKLSKKSIFICKYLINKNMIAILIDYIIQINKSNLPIYDPKLFPSKKIENEIGVYTQISMGEVQLQKKIKKSTNAYFWAFFTELLKHCNLNKKKYYNNYFSDCKLQINKTCKNIFDLLLLDSDFILKLLIEASSKFLIRKFVRYLCMIAIQNESFSKSLLKIIEKGLSEYEGSRFRSLLYLYKELIKISDQFQNQRLNGMNYILIAIENNKKYVLELNIIYQWIIKITKKSEYLYNYLKKNESLLNKLKKMYYQKKVSTQDLLKINKNIKEKIVHIYHGLNFPTSLTKLNKMEKSKQIFFQEIIQKNYEPYQLQHDSDDDLTQKEIYTGEKINIYHEKKQKQAIVMNIFYNYLTLDIQNEIITVWKDEEILLQSHQFKVIISQQQITQQQSNQIIFEIQES